MDWVEKAAYLKWDMGISWAQLPLELEREYGEKFEKEKVRAALRRHPAYKKTVQYEDKRECTEVDIEEYITQMKHLQAAYEKINTKQVKASLRIDDNKPIAVAYWADWHVGAIGADLSKLEKHLRMVRDTEGCYFIGGGDYKDNYISGTHTGGNFEQIIQPGMQDIVVKHYMEQVGDKCIALVRGCHDSWDKKQGDKDFLTTLCEATDSVNLWHGGDVTIKLGDQEYKWKCRHKYKYQSSLNLENAMRRIMEIQGPCDVAAEAHLHNPYTMQRHLMGQYRVLIRAGSYKIWDEYGQQLAGYKGKIGVPAVIMYPGKKKMLHFTFIEDALDVLKSLRSGVV